MSPPITSHVASSPGHEPAREITMGFQSVRSAMTDILMRCDNHCQEGVRAPTWVPGWIHPLRLAFNRAITPDRPTTARMATLIDDFFGQVSRAIGGGASGPEAFTLLLRLLVTHLDRVDTGKATLSCILLKCVTARLFLISVGSSVC